MGNTQHTDSELDADLSALDAHTAAVQALHQAAWRGPVIRSYEPGACVWMWDHYNTAVVVGPGSAPNTWLVVTQDADGTTSRFCYLSSELRPALAPKVFTWAADRAERLGLN